MSIWLKDKKVINEILNCRDKEGEIMTHAVLKKAENEDSPLHSYFEWDKSKAANEYNLIQARQLIRRVPVTYVNNSGEEKTVPRLVSVSYVDGEKNVRGYVDIEVITADEDKKRIAVRSAIKSIRRWQDIYESYNELSRIVDENEVVKVEKEYA